MTTNIIEMEQQRLYKKLVEASANYIVSCNISAVQAMKDDGEDYIDIMKDFRNYGVDTETVRMIMAGVLEDAAKLATEHQIIFEKKLKEVHGS